MSEDYSYNAPTFYDFDPQSINEDIAKVETYFEIDHESESPLLHLAQNVEPTTDDYQAESENIPSDEALPKFGSPISEISDNIEEREPRPTLRRSISAENLLVIENIRKFQNLKIDTKYDSESNDISNKNIVHNNRLSRLAQPRSAQKKYVSTAEQVNKFYGTPARFHSWQKKLDYQNKAAKVQVPTMPQSPSLATRRRQRNTTILSREEIEKQEVEELRKFKIKALPINQKILQGPVKPVAVAKKPATAIMPFNLTKCQSKKVEQTPEPYEFHARPVPKAIYEKTKLDQNKKLNTREFGSKEKLKVESVKTKSTDKPIKASRTEPAPFSFDTRDQQIPKRREQMVNKVLEEEKKAREFRANPPPQYVLKKTNSLCSLRTNKSDDEAKDSRIGFKARVPVVLYQKPFEPKKPERPLLEVTEFCLNSDRRAKEREEFDKKVQEKLNEFTFQKAQRDLEMARYEEEEIARLRKQTIHVSQPVRYYKELKIVPSGKITLPVTPKFKLLQRCNSQNKENNM